MNQRFRLLNKPGSCIKKWGFMQSFRSLNLPISSMGRNYLFNNRIQMQKTSNMPNVAAVTEFAIELVPNIKNLTNK